MRARTIVTTLLLAAVIVSVASTTAGLVAAADPNCVVRVDQVVGGQVIVELDLPGDAGPDADDALTAYILDANRAVVASAVLPSDGPQQVTIDISALDRGVYSASVPVVSGCETPFDLDSLGQLNQGPLVGADCLLSAYSTGDTVLLTGSAADPDGVIVRTWWLGPDELVVPGETIEYLFTTPGTVRLYHLAEDNRNEVTAYTCIFSIAGMALTPTPVSTPTPPATSTPAPTVEPVPTATPTVVATPTMTPTPPPTPEATPTTIPTPLPLPSATPSPTEVFISEALIAEAYPYEPFPASAGDVAEPDVDEVLGGNLAVTDVSGIPLGGEARPPTSSGDEGDNQADGEDGNGEDGQPTPGPEGSEPTPGTDPTPLPSTGDGDGTGTGNGGPDDGTDPDPTPDTDPEPTAAPDTEEAAAPGDLRAGDFSAAERATTIPGLLEVDWPTTMTEGETETIKLTIKSTDWREDAEISAAPANVRELPNPEVGRQTEQVAVYGVLGPLEIELLFNPDQVELVGSTNDDTGAKRTVNFGRETNIPLTWEVRSLTTGPISFEIRVVGLNRALNSLSDEELEEYAENNDVRLRHQLTVNSTARTEWHTFHWWHLLPLLLLPWPAVALLFFASRRRNPKHRAKPVPVHLDHDREQGNLSLVLSGGGLRATAFGLGVAMYLADASRWTELRQIASVSGGSMTAAFATRKASELGRAPLYAQDLGGLATSIASRGLPLERAGKILGAALALGMVWLTGVLVWAAPNTFTALPWIIVAALAFVLASWLIFGWLGVRPALARWIPNFTEVPSDVRLRDLGSGYPHRLSNVFTANTSDSDHAHLSQDQMVIATPEHDVEVSSDHAVPSERIERQGVPDKIRVAQAVQASAAFPGLPQVVLDPAKAGFSDDSSTLWLRDGGTSDNLGHISQTLFAGQSHELQQHLTANGAITRWIVVDSSAYRPRRGPQPEWRLRLLRALNIGAAADLAEMAGTASSRTTAESAARIKQRFEDDGEGVYLALRASPYETCLETLRKGTHADEERVIADAVDVLHRDGHWPATFRPTTERKARAMNALATLTRSDGRVASGPDWKRRSEQNAGTATTLSSLGAPLTADLLRHGYALAAIECHIEFGWELPNPKLMVHQRFHDITAGEASLPIDLRPSQTLGPAGTPVIELRDEQAASRPDQ